MPTRAQRRALFNSCLVAACLAGCSDEDFGGDTGYGIIEGTVQDANGDPIGGASISFVLTLEENIFSTSAKLFAAGVALSAQHFKGQHVSVKIYRPDGTLIRTLMDGPAEDLTFLTWDGRDESGRLAPANAYTVERVVSELSGSTPIEILRERTVVFLARVDTSELYEAYHIQTDSSGRFIFDAETSLGLDALINYHDENGEPVTTRVSRRIHAYAIIGVNGVATAFRSRSFDFPKGTHIDLLYSFESVP